MKAIMDLHTHTLAAGHAYSTLLENIDAALAMGLQYLGMSEHGPTSPGGPHNFFFSNYKVIPRIYDREENTGRVIPKPDGSLRLLCGVEANICSTNGELDLEERYLQKMDYALGLYCGKPQGEYTGICQSFSESLCENTWPSR